MTSHFFVMPIQGVEASFTKGMCQRPNRVTINTYFRGIVCYKMMCFKKKEKFNEFIFYYDILLIDL
jgi:hypothetical protein